MRPKVLISAIALTFLIFTAAKSFALPITAGDKVKMSVGSEYDEYILKHKDSGKDYISFCLESDIFFTPGVTYTVGSIGDTAYSGGTVRDSPGNFSLAVGGDKVEEESKWLLGSFLTDTEKSKDKRLAVQQAIWWLEGEIKGVESSWTNLMADYNWGLTKNSYQGWEFAAVNIVFEYTDQNGTKHFSDRQSQLVGVAPVPEPATMMLFGIGLAGLAGVQRRRKK